MAETFADKPDIDSLFNDLSHPNPYINKEAYMSLKQFWVEESLPKLITNLVSEDIHLRRVSVKALGFFGYIVLKPLAEIFRNTDNIILRISCLKTFLQVSINNPFHKFPEDIMQVIELAMEENSPEIILSTIPLLRQLGEQGLPLLIKASRDVNILKVSSALTALGEVDSPLARNALQDFLKNDNHDPMLRESALNAIKTFHQIESFDL